MKIFRSLDEIPPGFGPTVVSVGNFDGVHRGHRLILDCIRDRALARNARSVAVTFDPHPTFVLHPTKTPRLITPLGARLELLQATGIDAVLVLPFTLQLAHLSAAEFAQNVLRGTLNAIEVHEGANFRFGHHAHADVRELRELGATLGFDVQVHHALHRRGMIISSSTVRSLIAAGDVRQARSLMGHAFFVQSSPARGRGIGGKLLVPTINLAEYDELLPALGVYITCLRIREQIFQSITNVGNRPTFGADSFAVEISHPQLPAHRTRRVDSARTHLPRSRPRRKEVPLPRVPARTNHARRSPRATLLPPRKRTSAPTPIQISPV